MPLRVRCRCGQELVVRYSEWVYIFLGLSLLAVLLNTLAVVLLYFRLEEKTAPQEVHGKVTVAASPSKPPAAQVVPATLPVRPDAAHATPETAAPLTAAEASSPGAAPPPPSGSQPETNGERRSDGKKETPPPPKKEPLERAAAKSASPEEAEAATVAEILSPHRPPRGTAYPAGGETSSAEVAHRGLQFDGSPLERLLLLEERPARPAIASALLLDADARVRKKAIELLLEVVEQSSRQGRRWADDPDVSALLALSAGLLEAQRDGDRILASAGISPARAVGGSESTLPKDASEEAQRLDRARRIVSDALAAPANAPLRQCIQDLGSADIDICLAVDASQSMSGSLEEIGLQAPWLLAALRWAFPRARVGLVLYRDQVEKVVDFSASDGDLLGALRDAKAEGGGDVPEGVHHALRVCLSRGRLRWRDGGVKHVILVGDGPPPQSEVAGLVMLLAQAARQGGFRVHTLSIKPDEGRAAVPFFPELAAAGNGRAATLADMNRWGEEVLVCLAPAGVAEPWRHLLASTRALFAD